MLVRTRRLRLRDREWLNWVHRKLERSSRSSLRHVWRHISRSVRQLRLGALRRVLHPRRHAARKRGLVNRRGVRAVCAPALLPPRRHVYRRLRACLRGGVHGSRALH